MYKFVGCSVLVRRWGNSEARGGDVCCSVSLLPFQEEGRVVGSGLVCVRLFGRWLRLLFSEVTEAVVAIDVGDSDLTEDAVEYVVVVERLLDEEFWTRGGNLFISRESGYILD